MRPRNNEVSLSFTAEFEPFFDNYCELVNNANACTDQCDQLVNLISRSGHKVYTKARVDKFIQNNIQPIRQGLEIVWKSYLNFTKSLVAIPEHIPPFVAETLSLVKKTVADNQYLLFNFEAILLRRPIQGENNFNKIIKHSKQACDAYQKAHDQLVETGILNEANIIDYKSDKDFITREYKLYTTFENDPDSVPATHFKAALKAGNKAEAHAFFLSTIEALDDPYDKLLIYTYIRSMFTQLNAAYNHKNNIHLVTEDHFKKCETHLAEINLLLSLEKTAFIEKQAQILVEEIKDIEPHFKKLVQVKSQTDEERLKLLQYIVSLLTAQLDLFQHFKFKSKSTLTSTIKPYQLMLNAQLAVMQKKADEKKQEIIKSKEVAEKSADYHKNIEVIDAQFPIGITPPPIQNTVSTKQVRIAKSIDVGEENHIAYHSNLAPITPTYIIASPNPYYDFEIIDDNEFTPVENKKSLNKPQNDNNTAPKEVPPQRHGVVNAKVKSKPNKNQVPNILPSPKKTTLSEFISGNKSTLSSNPAMFWGTQRFDFGSQGVPNQYQMTSLAINREDLKTNPFLDSLSHLKTALLLKRNLTGFKDLSAYIIGEHAVNILFQNKEMISQKPIYLYMTGLTLENWENLFLDSGLKNISKLGSIYQYRSQSCCIFIVPITDPSLLPFKNNFAIEKVGLDFIEQQYFYMQKETLNDLNKLQLNTLLPDNELKDPTWTIDAQALHYSLHKVGFDFGIKSKNLFYDTLKESENQFVSLSWRKANISPSYFDAEIFTAVDVIKQMVAEGIADKKTRLCMVGSISIEARLGIRGFRNDTDFVIFGVKQADFIKKLKSLNIEFTPLDPKKAIQNVEVTINGKKLDFTCIEDVMGLEDNLSKRDAAATAIAIEIYPLQQVIGKLKWFLDFENKQIACTSNPTQLFASDFRRKIRMLRVIQKCQFLGFTPTQELADAIISPTPNNTTDPFAIAMQMVKLFQDCGVNKSIEALAKYNLLSQIVINPTDKERIDKLFYSPTRDVYSDQLRALKKKKGHANFKYLATKLLNDTLSSTGLPLGKERDIMIAKLLMLGAEPTVTPNYSHAPTHKTKLSC